MAMIDVDSSSLQCRGGLTAQVGWLVLRVGSHLTPSPHSSDEPGELVYWLCCNDSMINIATGIVVIIRPHRSTTYIDEAYYYRRSSIVC